MRKTLAFTLANFAVDTAKRTLTGMVLPFGEVSRPAMDPTTGLTARFSFSEGTVTVPDDPGEVVLNYGHDDRSLTAQIGVATNLAVESDGVHGTFRVARTPEGDRVLALADQSEGAPVLKAFSAEVDGAFEEKDGVQHATTTALTGAAVVPKPAFAGAHITSVAASAAPTKEAQQMDDNKDGGTVAFAQAEGAALQAQVSSLAEKIAEMEKISIPVGPGTAQFHVTEEPIYRFAGSEGAPSGFDFASDLLAAAKDGDAAAFERVKKFTAENLGPQFVATTDVGDVNQPAYRPDMFMGQAPTPQSPLYDTFYKGSLSNVTPFFWSKLDRANTDVGVGDHTEGDDPTAGNLKTAVGATVTPVPVSGKVHITREVADQGGNPQVSGLVWSEFDRSFKIALETKTAGILASAAATAASLTAAIAAGADGATAGAAVEAGLLGLQFLADGFRFTKSFGHVDLYTLLATYENSEGEKRYPIINPQNRSGISGDKYSFLDIAGYRMTPCASLGATSANASNSWVVDPNSVHVWNSGLTRLDKLQEAVEGWDMGVFGYFAGIVYDVTGLRKIAYDPAV